MSNTVAQLRSTVSILRSQLTKRGRSNAEAGREHENMHLLLAYCLKRDSNCVDVGASVGFFLKEVVRLAPAGKHYAFEPIPQRRSELAAKYPSAEVREIALSDAEGEATFNWLSDPRSEGLSGLVNSKYAITPLGQTLTVRTARLDDQLPSEYAPTLIKIDIEGGEMAALRGAENLLRRHRPILIIEFPRRGIPLAGATRNDLYHLLVTQLGYQVFDLLGQGPLRREDFDVSTALNFVFHQ